MPPETLNIPVLAAEFTAAHPDLDPAQQRLTLAAFLLLGEGEPLEPKRLAERTHRAVEEVASFLEELPMVHRDQEGRVVGFSGLTLEPTPHVLEVDGRRLYAWCALDTLFLPELLGRPARIRSTCPQTGEAISLTVADGIHDIVPADTVMSLHGAGGLDLDNVISSCCCFVHFFASEEAARAWTEGKNGTYVASISQGFEYGRLYNHGRFQAALEELRP
jgi:alkylmercury lyase